MIRKASILLIGLLAAGQLATLQVLAAQPVEFHGADSVFAKNGIVVVWAIEKRGNDRSPLVYLRIVRTPAAASTFRYYSLLAVDPFTGSSRPLVDGRPLQELNTATAEMAEFQTYSSRRILLFATEGDVRGDSPSMVVFYQGVPDTSPEFVDRHKLESYLADTVTRLENR